MLDTSLLALSTSLQAETFYFHNDHLGTPQVLIDSDGAVVWQGSYSPFGEVDETVDAVEQNIRFPGQYFEEETGLHYNYFRDYDPGTGRYVTSDPIGLAEGLNTYVYAYGNPVNYVDPLGLGVLVCNRSVNGFPFVGNHAYAWNTQNNTSQSMRGSSGWGQDPSGERGPKGDNNREGDQCNAVEGSDGRENEIMDYMKENQNNGPWTPFLNDCHNAIMDAVNNSAVIADTHRNNSR